MLCNVHSINNPTQLSNKKLPVKLDIMMKEVTPHGAYTT